MSVLIRAMTIADALSIERQPSQRIQLGLEGEMTREIAGDLIDGGEAWTAVRDDVPVACLGIRETFPGCQGVAWAILARGLGTAHLAVTRHARARIRDSALVRIEAIVRVACPAEVAWAKLAGLAPVALLRRFGAASEDHLLMERVRG